MKHALTWQRALFTCSGYVLFKSFDVWAKWAVPRIHMYIDASPSGYSAFFTLDSVLTEYLAGAWTESDLNYFGLKLGDCRGQAVWEALAILIAVRCWWGYWWGQLVVTRVRPDSKAAFGALE